MVAASRYGLRLLLIVGALAGAVMASPAHTARAAPSLVLTPDHTPCAGRVTIRGADLPPGQAVALVARRIAPPGDVVGEIAGVSAGADGAFTLDLSVTKLVGTCSTKQPPADGTVYAISATPGGTGDGTVYARATLTIGAAPAPGLPTAAPTAPDAGSWTPAVGQPTAATSRVAVALADGSVLLTGGGGEGGGEFAGAARFDPATGGWSRAADMPTARDAHTATLLADGRVLVAGGHGGGPGAGADGFINTAAIYDPATDTWAATGDLAADRARHFAIRLPDGRVLVGGGYNGNAYREGGVLPLDTAELYDPATGRWSPAASMRGGRGARAAAPLPDGTILATGGDGEQIGAAVAAAERYDPATDRWLDTAPPATPRALGVAIALADGSVLLVGGYSGLNDGGPSFRPLTTAERFVPEVGRWMPAGETGMSLVAGLGVPLPGDGALVVGMQTVDTARSDVAPAAARYDGLTSTWSPVGPPPGFTHARTATALPDGRVLVTGNDRDPQSTVQGPPGAAVAALYDGGVPARACFAETGGCVAGLFLARWLRHGGLAVNGLPLTAPRREMLEDGQVYTVQYFERARMEYHPENAPPHHILLGQFGRHILASVPDAPTAPVPPREGDAHFPETGHNVGPRFLAYWEANGGLAQFGFPLTGLFEQQLEDGRTYQVQYFERARFEYHPEHAGTPYEVLLGQFGRRILAAGGAAGR